MMPLLRTLLCAVAAATPAALPGLARSEAGQPGWRTEVAFSDYTPLSANLELARRLLNPLTAAGIPQILARKGQGLAEQPIDLARERFGVYLPARMPSAGYGLLVFVPPWPEARLPKGWAEVLDRFGIVFVTAAGSGNEADVLARREPLAILAEQNMAARYRIDPARVYVGGMSGGSRIALRLALAYPDLFTGALLNAGSDPIGDASIPLPPADLFARFQTGTRLVYVTGDHDPERQQRDADSRASMRSWCVQDLDTETMRGKGHETADAAALARALTALDAPKRPDPPAGASCRARIEAEVDERLGRVEALIAAGQRDTARKALIDLDARYGGLAAPRSVELQAQLDRSAPQAGGAVARSPR